MFSSSNLHDMNTMRLAKKVTKQAAFAIAASLLVVEQGFAAALPNGGTCAPQPGPFPPIGTTIAYELNGREVAAHRFADLIEGDKIVVETSVPAASETTTTSRQVYTQHIHKGSRQVVWTSKPITTRSIPGILPQSDYTDLWIPTSTPVGGYVNIQNQNMVVLQENGGILYVGLPADNATTSSIFGARMYDKNTGILRGFAMPIPTFTLKLSFGCDVPQPPVPGALFDIKATGPTSAKKHEEVPLRLQIKNLASTEPRHIIDVEVYDSFNRKVFQQFFEINETFATGTTREFTALWTPSEFGTYTVRLGVFAGGWQKLLLWNDQLLPKIAVEGGQVSDGKVKLLNAYITSTPYYLSEQAILHAEFGASKIPSESVLIDLELSNSAGKKVAQQVFDMVQITSSSTIDKMLEVPRNLPGGTYYFNVGIFKPGWQGLVTWYDKAVTFTLGASGQYEDGNVIMTSATATPAVIKQGEVSTLAAAFASPNTQNHVLLDLALVDAGGKKVASRVIDNVAFPRAGTGNYENVFTLSTPATLPSGIYSFDVRIFTLGRGAEINTYPKAATLKVEVK